MKILSTDPTVGLLQRALGRTSLRTVVTASNLANVDTPGFRAKEVSFRDVLAETGGMRLRGTKDGHLDPGTGRADVPTVRETRSDRVRADGNSVDVDEQMTRLAALQGRYAAAARLVRKRFALLRYAATDGRG